MRKRKKKIFGTSERPRLVVYRSLKYMHAQLVDDSQGKVLLGISDKSKSAVDALKGKKTKVEKSRELGKVLAKLAKEKKISKIVFDRNGYLYHGRVKSFAEGAREGGLEF
ncbi:MAG TPA: 50S ribosomal protein L18 [Caldithrix abyssi]|uniref:Large ribosomal subunit protein uL18 n=1 Tax=Caldithrix abyssi TaxID=187145 RepID=A0A7V5PPS0_CALAY|nr:50S ribosomal protein L18 [Caldithrix abyssi]